MKRARSDESGDGESKPLASTCHEILEEAQAIAKRLDQLAEKRDPNPDAIVGDVRKRLSRVLDLIGQLEEQLSN